MLRAILLGIMLFVTALPVTASASDANAAKRGVVRVVSAFLLNDGRIVGEHGSGFAVSRTRIVTNFHVVENFTRYRGDTALFVVPPEGENFYLARVIVTDRSRDLALLEVENANLPVLSVFSGAIEGGDDVTALGYPGNVDRASIGRAVNLNAVGRYLRPMQPELTEGNYSSSRQISSYTALVHSANIAQGNSGGPLVDECGRVIGVNSAQPFAENGDSSFGFAIANSELVRFLQQADQSFQNVSEECVTAEEFAERERAREAEEQRIADELLAQEQAEAERMEQAIVREIEEERETQMFLAIVMILGGGLAVGGSFLLASRGPESKKAAVAAGSLGAVLIVGALAVFATRPSITDSEIQMRLNSPAEGDVGSGDDALDDEELVDRLEAAADDAVAGGGAMSLANTGTAMTCIIDRDRSRITTTPPQDIEFQFEDDGCVNGSKQYAPLAGGDRWSRVLVPNSDATVSHLQYDPASARLTVDKYALDLQRMTDAREIRARITVDSCTADRSAVLALQDQQADILAALPATPNERMVYNCQLR